MDEVAERARRRRELTERLVDLVLREGLGTMGLRGLAKALGTSDRMLIYYYSNKENLVSEVLGCLIGRLLVMFSAAGDGERVEPGVFLTRALAAGEAPEVRPFMCVLSDVLSRGGRGERPYDGIASELVGSWTGFIRSRITETDAAPVVAIALLAIVEGMTVLELARPGVTAGVGEMLAGVLMRRSGRKL
ncbi:TetR/AcrR family transcriptional regulator [Acetobacter oeni]|nr:TetR/AcrR family transcriptional regulator [Acetobacter oeni]MBB3882476.1 AcrR family transcriptional regulator [Acetobacter oeni]